MEKLSATDGIRRFQNGLKTDKEKEDFRRHLRRYAQIYLPDCPFEVNATNRYTIVTQEAAITARRYIRRNESVKYLSGIQVVITPDEEKEISTRKKDFSIVVSSRNKCTSLFMGPARFANHDCDANAKLVTTSHAGIEIIATKNIDVGDEITVTYGENYFGEDNCECLCQSCETGLRNGWEPEEGALPVTVSIEDHEAKSESYSLRRRRMRDDSVGDSSRNSSATPVLRPKIPKTRISSSRLNPSRGSPAVDSPTPDNITPSGRKRPIDALATPPSTAKRMKHLNANARPMSRSSSSSRSGSSSGGDAADTDVTSPDKESPPPQMPTPSKELRSSKKPFDLTPMALSSILNTPLEDQPVPAVATRVGGFEVIDVASEAGEELKETVEEAPEDEEEQTPKRKKYQRRVFIKETTPEARVRTPGDYTLTPLLLAEPTMAWIQCGNCPTYFVQKDSYFTRSSCPRCERHSMIYGYIWPKTDKSGPKDKEERVLDHRTIHRFLDSHDERRARGHKGMREESEEPEEPEEPERGRPKKRGRPTKAEAEKKKQLMKKAAKAVQEEEDDDMSSLRRSGRPRRVSSRLLI